MRLTDLFENRSVTESSVTYNTARALAREIHGDMMDLLAIRQSAGGIESTPADFVAKLQNAIRSNILELEQLGYEFDWKAQDHLRPLTIDNDPQSKLQEMRCTECGGPAFSDLVLAEKHDACYNKVRSRYKVWPSAYASGALVQCRKKGAANWGNKSKNESADSAPKREPVRPTNPPPPVKKRPATPFGPGQQGVAEAQLDEKGWDTHRQEGIKRKGSRMVPNCVPK